MKRWAWLLLLVPPLAWSLPWLGGEPLAAAQAGGALIPERVLAGEWWRVFTAPLLHVHTNHLLVNLAGLAVFGHLAHAVFGLGRAASVAAAGGLASGLASLLWVDRWALGASGAVFALLGAAVIGGLRLRGPTHAATRIFLAAASVALAVSGPGNSVAHLAGLATGAAFAALFRLRTSA